MSLCLRIREHLFEIMVLCKLGRKDSHKRKKEKKRVKSDGDETKEKEETKENYLDNTSEKIQRKIRK
jgi:hypothetical protein